MTEQEIRDRLSGDDLSIFEQSVKQLIDSQAAEIAELCGMAITGAPESFEAWFDGETAAGRLYGADREGAVAGWRASLSRQVPQPSRDERKAFEAALRSRWQNICLNRQQIQPDVYALEQVEFAWQFWQVRASLQGNAASLLASQGVPEGQNPTITEAMIEAANSAWLDGYAPNRQGTEEALRRALATAAPSKGKDDAAHS